MKTRILSLTLTLIGLTFLFSTLQAQTLEDVLAGKIDLIVAQDGTGNFESLQAAIDAVPDSSETPVVVFIRRGRYYEKIRVPVEKTNLVLIGEDADSTILTYDDYPGVMPDNSTFGTFSFRCDADNFSAYNLTFENSAGQTAGQALAYSSYGDKQFFYHCRFLGNQDTYFLNFRCRNYMKDCYIEGSVDYIYGFGIGVYDSCQIHTNRYQGVITAPATSSYQHFGFTFRDCRITAPTGVTGIFLGRPWHGKPHTAFLFCDETAGLNPLGWRSMNEGLDPIFAEYACTGEGYLPDQRSTEPDYPGIQLSEAQAAPYQSLATLLGAASFADPSEDEAEILEMRTPFDEAGLTDLILEVMYRGRDTFPPIPADDWLPDLENDTIKATIDAFCKPFMDSAYIVAPRVSMIYADGNPLENFDAAVYEYALELGSDATTPAELTADAEEAIISIEYPGSVPAYSHVIATSPDRVTQVEYNIYNSVDSSYQNADLGFLGYNASDTIDLEDNKYNYTIMLEEGVSQVFSLQAKVKVKGASYKTNKPDAVPGDGTVDVTALDGSTTNTYTLHFILYTDLEQLTSEEEWIRIQNPVKDQARLNLMQAKNGNLQFRIFDMTGKPMFTHQSSISPANQQVNVDISGLNAGLYVYEVRLDEHVAHGRMVVE
ncbi:MAG: T9SS type A sorting domain-containing protein [Bacteroidales bacterium]|nr:T9SS type A sorting domain-containing protein [Bacteroidales bacterium]